MLVSRDYVNLKASLLQIVQKKAGARADNAYARWIQHLILLRELLEVDPSVGRHLNWEELRGLTIMDQVIKEAERMKDCPRCHQKTASLYTCEHCGLRLAA